jgi:hypothetical protein
MSALRSSYPRDYYPLGGDFRFGGARGSKDLFKLGAFVLTVQYIWRLGSNVYWSKRDKEFRRVPKATERKQLGMKFNGKNVRLEVLLEAPTWLLILATILVTVSVIASAVAL